MDRFIKKKIADAEQNIEELKRINEKLVESEKLKSEFLSNIRNEINNPLTSILGLSHLIKESENLSVGKMKKLAGLIHKEAFYLNLQLATIFAAADLEAGELFAEIGHVNIDDLISQIISEFQETAEERNVRIILENKMSHANRQILTDEHKLQIVLNCLIANAIEFSPPNSEIKVIVRMDTNGDISIAVKDNGIGIAISDQQKIFDRFMQLDSGAEKKFRGLGLGLSVAKNLVELLGGDIRLESAPGHGSTFEIFLPQKLDLTQLNAEMDEEVRWEYGDELFDERA